MPHFEQEIMSAEFVKWHIRGLPFNAVVHEFSEKDKGDAHDHPFDFISTILHGYYIEEIYHLRRNGKWTTTKKKRKCGDTFRVKATHIHQIVEMSEGGCYSLILPGKGKREWRFWSFDNELVTSRVWNETDFKPYNK